MAEFKNPKTGEVELEIRNFTQNLKTKIYRDSAGNELISKDGVTPLEMVIIPKDYSDPESMPQFLSFASKSNEEKKSTLLKRSKNQSIQANRELKDKKEWIDGKGEVKAKPKKKILMNDLRTGKK